MCSRASVVSLARKSCRSVSIDSVSFFVPLDSRTDSCETIGDANILGLWAQIEAGLNANLK